MSSTMNVISKRYVKSLLDSFNDKELGDMENILKNLTDLFTLKKFSIAILSPEIGKDEKKELVLSCVDTSNGKFVNFINLLSEYGRLYLIPSIYKELKFQLATKNNCYEGEIISEIDISKEQLVELEKGFSKKFGSTIKLKPIKQEYSGVKIQIIDIGVEVSLSFDRLKTQMADYILKAI